MITSIVLADDHRLFLEGLRSLLSQEPDFRIVAEASTGLEAVAAVREKDPDVVVMDVSMPELNGLEATRQISSEHGRTKVVCLSMYGGEDFVAPALQYGAAAYLLKECATEELVQAIRCVCRGLKYLSPDVAGAAVNGLISGPGGSGQGTRELTRREVEVLQLIAEGYASKEIAAKLNVSVKTVATHRSNLTDKLDVRGTAGLTKYAIRRGIVSLDIPQNGS